MLFQAIIDAWQKGLSALTHRSAYDKKIQNGFMGNVFDFISIPIKDTDLAYIVTMKQYFATFLFNTFDNAKTFDDLVESLVLKPVHLYVCSVEQNNSERMEQLVEFDSISTDDCPYIQI